ncbi:hypothetical protein DJ568_03035 [Mucilaginibacter hurinus]|uniref:Uncharacterized protein n=1 Tax=Mucilaginibacter hurinus TaxID=2201324 RepID=A0A367GUU1_9SPHI|nr:hypothetical protein [Mucilaginibacter hurinus]RCH56845.1 hypothetical protein DJ568_03035 [Mucilaginibacter hurinus]
MNYLDEWYDSLQAFKWKNALVNDPHFRNLDAIKNEVGSFFPEKDLQSPLRKNHDNWLLHILADKQPSSIYLLNEVAELIKFYRKLPNGEALHIFQKNGKINYRSFNEKLFELQVNYLLRSVGLHPQIGQSYLLDGNEKEIDLLLEHNGQTYNIEVTKYYDAFTEELLALSMDIIGTLHQTTIKRTLTLDEIFSGYIAFKKRKDGLIKQNKELFHKGVKDFIHGYRSVKEDDTIRHPAKKETDDLVFQIEPVFSQNYERTYDQKLDRYPGYIKFKIEADLKTNRYHANAYTAARTSVEDGNKRLIGKIREKLKQHSKYQDGLLVIVLAIEQVFSSFSNNRAIPIRQNDVDKHAIHAEIRGKAAVVLLFKELKPDGISYQKMILGDKVLYSGILDLILKIYPNIRYITDENTDQH